MVEGGPRRPALYVVLYCVVCWRGSPSSTFVCCTMLFCVVEGAPLLLHCMLYYRVLYRGGAPIFLHCRLYYVVLCGEGGPHPPALYAVLKPPALYTGVGPHPPALYVVSYCIVRCVVERAPIPLQWALYYVVEEAPILLHCMFILYIILYCVVL